MKDAYLIADFGETPKHFQEVIKDHWLCETYHYHKDMLICKDNCKLSINPSGLSIFSIFLINVIQLYLV